MLPLYVRQICPLSPIVDNLLLSKYNKEQIYKVREETNMTQQSRKMAICSMTAALGVVVMLLGSVLDLGMYACPMFVGLFLIPIRQAYGSKYQLMLWVVISILSFLLIPNPEESLMFAGLFGWYPALRPRLQKLPQLPRIFLKLLVFNAAVMALEALVLFVLVPETISGTMLLLLLLLGNVVFLLYDKIIPNFPVLLQKFFKHK